VRSIVIADEFVKVLLSTPSELVQITLIALIAYVPSGKAIEVFGEAVLVIHVTPLSREYLTEAALEASAETIIAFALLTNVVEVGNETEVMTVSAHNAVFVLEV
jgi:hypothetical protein